MRSGEPSEPLYGLEAAIWEDITGDREKDRVRKIIKRIIRTTCLNPWPVIVEKAREGLLEHGYLVTEKEERRFAPDKIHWSADEALVAPLEGKVDEVKGMLSSFEVGDPTVCKHLVEAVEKGIAAMEESTDYDFD